MSVRNLDKLFKPEAVALISDFIVEGARDGRTVADLMQAGAHVVSRAQVMDGIADMIPEFRKMATEAGRDPSKIEITVWFPKKDAGLMKRYEDLGVSRVVFNLESEKADTIMPVIDGWAKLMAQANR